MYTYNAYEITLMNRCKCVMQCQHDITATYFHMYCFFHNEKTIKKTWSKKRYFAALESPDFLWHN